MGEDEPNPADEAGFWPKWLTPRRIAEFAGNVWRMEKAVDALKEEQRELRAEVDAFQLQMAVQARQLEVLSTFIQTSLNDRIDMKAENAALKALMTFRMAERPQDK